MKNMIKNLGKVGLAGATIAAIGWGFLTFNTPDEPVQEADADVWMMNFAPRTQQEKFVETLLVEGMEEPRTYDWNGNKVFFSTTTTEESPKQVLQRYQRAFVDMGVNEHVHLSTMNKMEFGNLDDPKEREEVKKRAERRMKYYDDFFGGGIVPVQITDDKIAMAGTESPDRAADAMDFVANVIDRKKKHGNQYEFVENFKNMRYVDAFREGSKTRITAVWSDDEMELGKIANKGEDLNVDPDRPACVGCERVLRFEGTGDEEAYDNLVYDAGKRSMESVLREYNETLTSKGWRPAESSRIMLKARRIGLMPNYDGHLVSYARGGDFLTLVAYPNDKTGNTTVHLFESN